ncbi:secreted RxLR effector protein 161-like, partial [Capsicum annuum]|uniref:secreted RxLR effector protein 161-like n=1 Tax=Capsicum annuum TaxID=4072 RepID=UPI001FB12E66
MEKYSSSLVSIQKGDKFSLNQFSKNDLERKQIKDIPYASIVGSLMYAQTCTRPDISFAVDSDYAGCVDTRNFTFGYLFLLTRGAISWRSVKQSVIAASTMEAEYVACFEATVQANWLRNFISGLGLVDNRARTLKIYCDNTAA